jgi:hypothetical protein
MRALLACVVIGAVISLNACTNTPPSSPVRASDSVDPATMPGWEPGGVHRVRGDTLLKGKWFKERPDPKQEMDDGDLADRYVVLEADDAVTLHHDGDGKRLASPSDERPTIMAGCDFFKSGQSLMLDPDHEFKVSIDINAASHTDAEVRLRFDKDPVSSEHWKADADSLEFLDPPDPEALVKRMEGAESLLFEFTPAGESAQTVRFDLRGLPDVLHDLDAVCKKPRP